jgi:hypothetical protein
MDRAVVSAALTNLGVLICGLLFLFAGMAVLLWAGPLGPRLRLGLHAGLRVVAAVRRWWSESVPAEVVAFWRYRWTEKKAERR